MVAAADLIAERLMRLYAERGDVDLAEFIGGCRGGLGPDDLAELIDTDGRLRIERGIPVALTRYLHAVPDLAAMPVALDAAIEFTLRSVCGEGTPSTMQVASLIAEYPMFERAIRAASLLSEALWSTEQVRSDAGSGALLPVPSDFGPHLPSGAPRYELREVLGSGAQGAVYLAVDRHLSDRTKPAWVAIKVLRRHVGDAVGRDRLIEEATRARRIDHPNIVRVLDRGVSDAGDDYIVYEYVDGTTLRGWAQTSTGPIAPRVAAELGAKIARGVQAAHSVGVVHCDIKPDNILMPRGSEPKVTDFGLAVRVDTEADTAAARPSDGPMGNLGFISPEQFRLEEGAISPPADVYACGGVLYYLLTGLLPNGQSVEEVERNLAADAGRIEPPSIRAQRPEVDTDLESICRRALAGRPADRYSSAEAFANDLEAWLRREPIRWTRPPLRRRAWLFCRREPLALALLLVLIATVGVAGGVGVAIAREGERRVMQQQVDAAKEIYRQTLDYQQRLQDLTNSMAASISPGNDSGLSMDWMMIMMVFETLLGPELTKDAERWGELRDKRIERVRSLAGESVRMGREMDLEAILWETLLGYFMLCHDRPDEGLAVLTENRARLTQHLSDDDRYLRMIDQMLACGFIMLVGAMPEAEAREHRAKLVETADFLVKEERTFLGRRSGSAMHMMILTNLAEVYGGDLLNKRDIARMARNKIIQFNSQR